MSSARNERQRAQRSNAASPERRTIEEVLSRSAPLLCVVVAVAVACTALIPSLAAAGWRPSVLVRMSDQDPLAESAFATDPAFAFVPPGGHYDGVYYYAIARDPFGRDSAHTLIDQSVYRYGHPAYGWLAGLASLGQPEALPAALLKINLAGLALGAYLISLIARALGRSPWWGLLVAFTPGFIFGVTNDTPEPVLVAVSALGLLLWLQRRRAAGFVLAAGSFVYPEALLIVLGLGVYECAELLRAAKRLAVPGRQGRLPALATSSRPYLWRMAILALAPVAYALWWWYLRVQFGSWPYPEPGNITAPGLGIADTLQQAAGFGFGSFDQIQLGAATVPILAALSGALVFGLMRSVQLRTPFQGIALVAAILLLSLGWRRLLYPKELIRTVALPVTFLILAFLAHDSPAVEKAGSQREEA